MLVATDDDRGWVGFHDTTSRQSSIIQTGDGGKTWSRNSIETLPKEVLQGFYFDGQRAWVSGEAIYRME